jgi:endonuclease YncB( thermonuclease family)
MIGGKRVTVFISSSRDVTPEILGEMHVGNEDVANEMLRKGWTEFAEAPAYTVSATSECENRLAAENAQKRHRGIRTR